MTTKTLFVITDKSEMERWEISRRKIDFNETINTALTSGMVRRLDNAFSMHLIDSSARGNASISVGSEGCCVVLMPLASLKLTAPFAVEGAICYPQFDGPHPTQSLIWFPPPNMHLWLCAHINSDIEAQESFLVATDDENRAWRMPLSNLYEDCKICMGRYNNIATDTVEVCRSCWNQFYASAWNSDFYQDASSARRLGTKALFSFNITNDGFTQCPPPSNWSKFCDKVGTDFITRYITR